MMHLKSRLLVAFLLTALILGLIPITAYAASPEAVVIGNSYTLKSGESLNDDLFILGGNVNLSDGSTVNGSIIVIGGNIDAAGTINGDMVVLGGNVKLANSFLLNGNFSTAGAAVTRETGAQITGEIYTGTSAPQIFIFPGVIRLNNLDGTFNPYLKVVGFFLGLLIWVLVAMVVAMFFPHQLNRTSQTVLSEPVASGGIGCLTIIIAPIVIVLLAITICLIPVSLLAAFILALAWIFGIVSLGTELGRRVSLMFNRQWHPAISAGLGTLLLMAVLNGLNSFIPCVGWLPKVVVGFFGLGAVLLTQFGTKIYPDTPSTPPQNNLDILPPQPLLNEQPAPPVEEPPAPVDPADNS